MTLLIKKSREDNYNFLILILRFKPGRDIGSLEALLDRLSLRLDLPRGARHIFSMDGDRKLNLDELEDGASYVVSSYKSFKVRFYYCLMCVCTAVHNKYICDTINIQTYIGCVYMTKKIVSFCGSTGNC